MIVAVDDEAFQVGSRDAYPTQLQDFGCSIEDPRALADCMRLHLDPMVRWSSRAALPCR